MAGELRDATVGGSIPPETLERYLDLPLSASSTGWDFPADTSNSRRFRIDEITDWDVQLAAAVESLNFPGFPPSVPPGDNSLGTLASQPFRQGPNPVFEANATQHSLLASMPTSLSWENASSIAGGHSLPNTITPSVVDSMGNGVNHEPFPVRQSGEYVIDPTDYALISGKDLSVSSQAHEPDVDVDWPDQFSITEMYSPHRPLPPPWQVSHYRPPRPLSRYSSIDPSGPGGLLEPRPTLPESSVRRRSSVFGDDIWMSLLPYRPTR